MIAQDKALAQKIIERINEHGKAQKITELCLDEIHIGSFDPKAAFLVQKCTRVQHLSVANCGLDSLLHFPKLPRLKYLDLQQNSLTQHNLSELESQLQILQGLNISKNNINQLRPIVNCVNKLLIRQINVFETRIFESDPKIIETLFENCKSLQCINWQDRKGKQVKEFEADSSSSSSESRNSSENDDVNDQSREQDSAQQYEELEQKGSKKIKVE